ncbi:uncharacterized protein BP01DRAFT_418236 [Aspergillus saccharolyticus JOP 1030-1]|uniref:S-adenosyl-L-methionine-dependent methyltransferase n=1 Tax=Aspergillus saccharolyticus JOP 1030-1 TaxID=1450539 RepID=A0A318Z4A0_9EURO|nr:hypothetical protein BP01DRAFT_418236 [Aspergillus saccharolyticus JOP 1030-1]PYH42145.1 hypothetical protein BP01DRAFT_418236 [Aspergillus saccharolyticus JOP 1030-1]
MSRDDDYVLGRELMDSVRLDAQHLLWKLHTSYELHPAISVTDDMKIADLGTGTGNVSLCLLDCLLEPPISIHGQYDVVHLRMWASNIRENDTAALMRHVQKLLKPGGYIQWEDADLIHQTVQGSRAQEFEEHTREIFQQAGLDYSWVANLPHRLQKHHFHMVALHRDPFEGPLAQLCTRTYLAALMEILRGIKRTTRSEQLVHSVNEQMVALGRLSAAYVREGIVYNWLPVALVAWRET